MYEMSLFIVVYVGVIIYIHLRVHFTKNIDSRNKCKVVDFIEMIPMDKPFVCI